MTCNREGAAVSDEDVREMQFDFAGLINLVAKHLYSEKKVFIRELIQNAHDGVRRRSDPSGGYGRIDIETRPQDLAITIRDNGIGMDREDLVDYLSNIGRSLTKLERSENDGLIGQFGIGFLSAFIVARHVEVRTRKDGDSSGWRWENDGGKEYRITECDTSDVGTTVTVHLRDIEDRGLIQEQEVRGVIRKYADMLTVPIHLNGSAKPENTMHMPWEKSGLTPSELEYDCLTYLARTTPEGVLEAIPVRITEPVRVEGVLYITRYRLISVDQPRTMRVFQNRMFLCENAADILPQWARFVNGIINTPDLTPTAARDNFIRDETAERVREALGEVIIEHFEKLRRDDPARFADIARFHRLGFAAACYYYDDFFDRFADLLIWRTNLGARPETAGDEVGMPIADLAPEPRHANPAVEEPLSQLHSLPEILATLSPDDDGFLRLPCVTTGNTAQQYFEIADAEGRAIVDASGPFESELLERYTRLPGRNLRLVHIDREEDPSVFRQPGENAAEVVRLAETMSLMLRTPFGGRIRTEARRFRPIDIAAVIRSDARTRAQQKADEVRLDPNVSDEIRQMAVELAQLTSTTSRRLTVNADNPLVQRLARQELAEPAVQQLMQALYNNAVLANRELITPTDAKIFHTQFQELIGRSLDFLEAQDELVRMREEQRGHEQRRRALSGIQPRHRIFFMITPFSAKYAPTISACRRVVEDQWGCQLIVASDRQDDHRLLDNVEHLMRQAHAFIAEVSEANPNVMFELGAAFADRHNRPFVLLRQNEAHPPLPADLRSLLYVDYAPDSPALDEYLAQEMRKNTAIREILDAQGRAQYLSPRRLAEVIKVDLPSDVVERLANRFPTREDWSAADVAVVGEILRGDSDFATAILRRATGLST